MKSLFESHKSLIMSSKSAVPTKSLTSSPKSSTTETSDIKSTSSSLEPSTKELKSSSTEKNSTSTSAIESESSDAKPLFLSTINSAGKPRKSLSSIDSSKRKPKSASFIESPNIELITSTSSFDSSISSTSTSESSDKQIQIMTTEMIESLLSKKSRIGGGATSTVYKVKNIFTNEGYLAIKILNDNSLRLSINDDKDKAEKKKPVWGVEDDDDDDDFEEETIEIDIAKMRKIYQEYEILKNLNHPNIVRIYGFYFGDKKYDPAILLEYCKFNLEQAIKYFDDVDLVGVIYEICSAMMYIHKMKLIHRDLKATNILIDFNKHVKICDFGLSKMMDISTQTTDAHAVGTFLYMAPELFQLDSKINEKIDVYAFGVVAYFILTKGNYPAHCGPGNMEKAKIPISINKVSMSIIKSCWFHSPEKRPSFRALLKFIVKNKFLLIDGIEDKIPALKKHLGLK